ncbi:MAG: hypothetical protein AB7V14_11745 [Kiritimatiellia bacterium]
MKTASRIVSTLCLALACAAPALAQGSGGESQSATLPWMQFEKELGLQTTYSVDMVMQMMGMNMESRTVRSGGKTRTEMTMPFMNLKMVALAIPQGGKTVTYSLFPDKKKYVLNTEADEAAAAAAMAKPQIENLGTEAYEGEPCLKRRVTMTQQGIRSEMIMLFSPRQKNMPVKMTLNATVPATPGQAGMPIQSVILFKNYDFSVPNDSLFVVPADYVQAADMQSILMESMPDMGAMMQQMQRQMPAAAE